MFVSIMATVVFFCAQAAARPSSGSQSVGGLSTAEDVAMAIDLSYLEIRDQQAQAVEASDNMKKEHYVQLFSKRNFQGRNITYGPRKICGKILS